MAEAEHQEFRMEIQAVNFTPDVFSAGPAAHMPQMQTIAYAPGSVVYLGLYFVSLSKFSDRRVWSPYY